MRTKHSLAIAISMTFVAAEAAAAPVVFSAAGANPAGIQTSVDAFRTALGSLNPNVAGSFVSGRREINWDGVPNGFAAPNSLPANFFNVNSPRGVVFSTPGAGVQVSANAGVAPIEFDNIAAGNSALFSTFSAQRLFTAVGSNIVDAPFFVPGFNIASTTSAFGVVFSDVDLPNVTSLEFFDASNVSLGLFYAPVLAGFGNESLSFIGVLFDAGEQIGRVRITSGNAALGGVEGGGADLVVMDDFIYAEPAAVPIPAALWLFGAGLAGLGAASRQRKTVSARYRPPKPPLGRSDRARIL